MIDYSDKIESLKNEQKQIENLFWKLQGKIELLDSMQEKKSEKNKK